MNHKHGHHEVALVLKRTNSVVSEPVRCIYCGRMLCKLNNRVLYILVDDAGIHLADLPDDQTMLEVKCRGCDYLYKIYTPWKLPVEAMVDVSSHV